MHNLEEKPITLSPGVGSDTVLTRLDVYGNGEDSPSSPQSADIDSAVVETIVPQIARDSILSNDPICFYHEGVLYQAGKLRAPAPLHLDDYKAHLISVTMDSDSSSESTTGEVTTTEVTVVSGDLATTPLVSANPHFITVTVAGDDSGTHPTFVQYVEADLYQEQTQIGVYPVYTVSEYGTGTAQGQTQQQYYTSVSQATSGTAAYVGNTGPTVVSTAVNTDQYILPGLPSEQDAIVVQQSPPPSVNTDSADTSSSAYLPTGGVGTQQASGAVENGASASTVNVTRISPLTVTWLVNNYETAEGVSLPRSTLYAHYMRHCLEHKIDPVNAASFGKLIRSVFMGLRTRRLGTRGNSKYHYYGIRIKPGSDLNATDDNKSPTAGSTGPIPNNTSKLHRNKPNLKPNHYDGTVQYLGDGNNAIPSFPEIEFGKHISLPEDCSVDDVDTFRSIYREHCEAFLDAILNLEFSTIETLWREFWRSNNNNNGDECEEEKYLSKSKLYQLCSLEPVQTFIVQVDFMFYQNIVDVLLPDVLRPIPSTLTQAIRNFAKGLENWLSSAMTGLPSNFIQSKMTAVSAFGQTLRRYTSLNHLAQAARAVLQNSSQISQMLSDLNRVDFHNVQEQAAYVCQCDTMIVRNLEDDFKYTLQQQNSLEQWAIWLKSVMANALRDYHGKPSYARAARQFLLKWSFYSSMIIRDLTLRSAASFGSFHLIRLLYDEYMFYLVEHEVARSNGTTPIAAMADVMSTQAASNINLEDEEPLDKKIKLS